MREQMRWQNKMGINMCYSVRFSLSVGVTSQHLTDLNYCVNTLPGYPRQVVVLMLHSRGQH